MSVRKKKGTFNEINLQNQLIIVLQLKKVFARFLGYFVNDINDNRVLNWAYILRFNYFC